MVSEFGELGGELTWFSDSARITCSQVLTAHEADAIELGAQEVHRHTDTGTERWTATERQRDREKDRETERQRDREQRGRPREAGREGERAGREGRGDAPC
eukprot:3035429-Rhodomonas_salina.1